MNLQTELMRETPEREVYAMKNANGTYSAIEYVNHPTPSGCPRMLPTYSDNREWKTEEEALSEFKKLLDIIEVKRKQMFDSILGDKEVKA